MKKSIINFVFLCLFLFVFSSAFAESYVYVIIDHNMPLSTLSFKVNGVNAFDVRPDVQKEVLGMKIYKKALRKITFKNSQRCVVSYDTQWYGKPWHLETILNLEDGETYYLKLGAKGADGTFEEISEKEGMKFVKKAEKSKDITTNEDFVYEN